jgi:hypothetical protein
MIEPAGRRAVAIAVVAVALLVAGVVLLAARPGRFDPLGPSTAVEGVRRTARLAGFETATAGMDGGTAWTALTVPAVSSAADVEIAWQTGIAALAAAYPGADQYVVRVLDPRQHLLVVQATGESARRAVERDDPRALLDSAQVGYARFSDTRQNPETEVGTPSVEYLDAKNRAAGLLDDTGPTVGGASALAQAVEAARSAVPGIPAPPPDTDAGVAWASATLELVREQTDVDGAAELAAELASVAGPTAPERVLELRALYMTAQALEPPAPFGSVLATTADACREVLDAPLAEGAARDAVLAAATPGDAPASGTRVGVFERVESLDAAAPYAGASLPACAHAVADEAGISGSAAGKGRLRPEVWEAYRRADGVLYWLSPDDGVALTDASVRGWAFSIERAGLVDAESAGVVLGYVPVQ